MAEYEDIAAFIEGTTERMTAQWQNFSTSIFEKIDEMASRIGELERAMESMAPDQEKTQTGVYVTQGRSEYRR